MELASAVALAWPELVLVADAEGGPGEVGEGLTVSCGAGSCCWASGEGDVGEAGVEDESSAVAHQLVKLSLHSSTSCELQCSCESGE